MIYEILKKSKLNSHDNIVDYFVVRRKILGISFYKIGDIMEHFITFFSLWISMFGTVSLLVLSISSVLPIYNILLIPVIWYFWHLTAKKQFRYEDDANKWVRYKIKSKNENVVIKYVMKNDILEIEK